MSNSATPWTATCQALLSFTTSGVCSCSCPLNQCCYPAISSSPTPYFFCLQSFPASGYLPVIQLLISACQSIGSFSFSISPSNEYSGLISFRINWFALLSVHGNLKSLFQHYNLKASILQFSVFFMVQLSH